MRASVALLGVVACYSPEPPLGVPCDDTTGCPAGQICVTRGGAQVCAPLGSGDDPDATLPDGSLADVPLDWWNTDWKRRRPIDVVTGAAVISGYSFAVTVDHAAQVVGGRSLASGDDLRIVRDDGLELHRVLDTGTSFDSSSTTLWFATPAPIGAGATQRFWLYSDNPTAGSPPALAHEVFAFADDFEGTLGQWNVDPKVEQTTTRAHRGAQAVFIAEPQAATGIGLHSKNLDLHNLVFDAWWNIDDRAGADMGQSVRHNATSVYFTNLQPPSPTWDISKLDNNVYSQLIAPPQGSGPPPVDTWFRVTVYAHQLAMAVDIDGERFVPTAGFATVDADPSGGVELFGYIVPSHVWWDDVTVRHFVRPEPMTSVGDEQSIR